MKPMAETTFSVNYDGPALEDGRMPVRELAPALLALGELFRVAGAEVYPDLPAPTLEVKATEKGSFDVHLIINASSAWQQVMNMLNAEGTTALATLEALIFGTSGVSMGVYKFIKMVKRRKIKKIEATANPDMMKIIFDDDTMLEAPAGTVKIYRNPAVRKAARDSVAPAKREGIDHVEFRPASPEVEPLTVEADEVDDFDLPSGMEDDELVDDMREAVVSVIKTDFGDGRWKVNDGTATFGVEMEDQGFKGRIDHGEPFRKGDLLRARIRTIQSTKEGKLQNDYRLVEVIEHIKGGEQLYIDSESGAESEPDAETT
jgi:hypothetical protein